MNSEKLKSIGQACFGRSWQAQLADRLQIDRRRVSNWAKGEKVPKWVDNELKTVVETRYYEMKKAFELLKENDNEI